MRHVLVTATARLFAWTLGLVLANLVVPGVSVSTAGLIVAVAFFAVAQTTLSLWILKLPHGYASLLLGGSALAMTFVAIALASSLTRGLNIDGTASWFATTILVWLATTIGAILLPDVYGLRRTTPA
jgi:hypothetical protein